MSKEKISLREHIEALLDERDKRYEERFEAMQVAVQKAEAATEKRFESVNEFRSQLSDQSRTFMPRSESETLHNNEHLRLDGIEKRVEKMENVKQGGIQMWVIVVGVITVIGIILTLIIKFK